MPKRQFLFSAVFGFRNPTQEIFSELDETKAELPIFHGGFQNTEGETERALEVATPPGGAAREGPMPRYDVGPPWPPSGTSLAPWVHLGKIEGLAFVSSNSENISCVGFLKPKTA